MFCGLSGDLLQKVNNNTYFDALCYSFVRACSHTENFQITFCEPGNLRFMTLCELFPSTLYPKQFYASPVFRAVIYYSDLPYANIFYKDGKQYLCTFEELNDYILAKDSLIKEETVSDIECVVLGIPEINIPKQMRIVLADTVVSSYYEPVVYNDILSSDLAICIFKDSDFSSSNYGNTLGVLKKCTQSGHAIVIYNADTLQKDKNYFKGLISQESLPKGAFDDNIFIVQCGNGKKDFKGIKRLLRSVEKKPEIQLQSCRNQRIRSIISKIQTSCQDAINAKKRVLEAASLKNTQINNKIEEAGYNSQVFWSLLSSTVSKYSSTEKRKTLNDCKQILLYRIAVTDPHILGVDAYSALSGTISAFIRSFHSAVEDTRFYNDICRYIKMPELNINNIFKDTMRFSYVSSQSRKSYTEIPNRYINGIKKRQAEYIIHLLSRNIDNEIEDFLRQAKEIINNNITSLKNSDFTIPYDQIQRDINVLESQCGYFKSLT